LLYLYPLGYSFKTTQSVRKFILDFALRLVLRSVCPDFILKYDTPAALQRPLKVVYTMQD